MGRRQRCVRLAEGALSADPSVSGGGTEVTLFDEGNTAADNLGMAVLEAVASGHMAAAFQDGEMWIVVCPHGTGGEFHLNGALTSQLQEES